jgi:hypothetical protein
VALLQSQQGKGESLIRDEPWMAIETKKQFSLLKASTTDIILTDDGWWHATKY